MWWPTTKWDLVKMFWKMLWPRSATIAELDGRARVTDFRTSFAHVNPPPTMRPPPPRIPDGCHFTIVPQWVVCPHCGHYIVPK